MDVFNKFLIQEDGCLSAEIGSAAILKYPQNFVSEFSSVLEAGFNEDIRIFRRVITFFYVLLSSFFRQKLFNALLLF